MNIISKNIKTPHIFTNKEVKKPMRTKDEIIDLFIDKGTEHLANRAEREVPENGQFTHIFVAFDVPESENEAILEISHNPLDPKTKRNFSVNVHRKVSDMFVSQNLFTGTKKEMLEYLKNKDIQTNIASSVKELSASVDEKM